MCILDILVISWLSKFFKLRHYPLFMYDVIIIGGGAAGLSAAIYSARKNLKTAIISESFGGLISYSSNVENYLGTKAIPGYELSQKFLKHAEEYEIDFKEEKVSELKKIDSSFIVFGQKEYHAKSVIIATGSKPRKLGIPGEKEFSGKGVIYCTTCDGPMFAGLDVAVIGSGNSGLDSVIQLMPIAKHIYLIEAADQLFGDKALQDKILGNSKVTIMTNTKTKEIIGTKEMEKLKVDVNGKEKLLDVQGVSINIGYIPDTSVFHIVQKNERGEIIINNKNETNVPGIFAAGDCSDVPEKQVIIAAGEGAKAAISAFKYLAKN